MCNSIIDLTSTPQDTRSDRVFYKDPAISPYLNLTRPSGPDVNNYYQYVRPEQARRAQQQATTRRPNPSAQFSVPSTTRGASPTISVNPSANFNNYYKNWYKK